MTRQARKNLRAVSGATGVCILAWLRGFNFNERGDVSVMVAVIAIVVAFFVYDYPDKED